MHSALAYRSLNRAAVVFDRLRTHLLAVSAQTALLRTLVVNKEARIVGLSMGHASLAWLAALVCPSLLLVLGPVLLGVPHVASDIRYLVLRRPVSRGFVALVLGFSALLVGTRLVELGFLGNPAFARLELGLVLVWLLLALGFTRRREPLSRRLAVALGALALGALALSQPTLARLVFAHAHNVIGLVVWYALFRPRRLGGLLPLAWIALGALLLYLVGSGSVGDSLGERLCWPEWFDLHIASAAQWLAPGLAPAEQRGLVLCYAFLQSVHYAVWLAFIPQDERQRAGSPTFCMSLKSAWHDFRPFGVALIALGMLTVLVAAFVDPLTTSAVYLFITPFHGYLELVVLACWLSERRLPARTQADALIDGTGHAQTSASASARAFAR